MKGGTPYGIEVTGYYDNDGKLIDIRTRNYIDPGKYKQHHGIDLPIKSVTEQIMDLFTFDPNYVSKANKRLQNYFGSDTDIKPITKYIVVNDEDDMRTIRINNDLLKNMAALKKTLSRWTAATNKSNSITKLQAAARGHMTRNRLNQKTESRVFKGGLNNITYDSIKSVLLDGYTDSDRKIAEKLINKEQFKKLVETTIPGVTQTPVVSTQPLDNDSFQLIMDAIEKVNSGVQQLNSRITNVENYINSNNSNTSNTSNNNNTSNTSNNNNTSNNSNKYINNIMDDTGKVINQGISFIGEGISSTSKNLSNHIHYQTFKRNAINVIKPNTSIISSIKNKIKTFKRNPSLASSDDTQSDNNISVNQSDNNFYNKLQNTLSAFNSTPNYKYKSLKPELSNKSIIDQIKNSRYSVSNFDLLLKNIKNTVTDIDIGILKLNNGKYESDKEYEYLIYNGKLDKSVNSFIEVNVRDDFRSTQPQYIIQNINNYNLTSSNDYATKEYTLLTKVKSNTNIPANSDSNVEPTVNYNPMLSNISDDSPDITPPTKPSSLTNGTFGSRLGASAKKATDELNRGIKRFEPLNNAMQESFKPMNEFIINKLTKKNPTITSTYYKNLIIKTIEDNKYDNFDSLITRVRSAVNTNVNPNGDKTIRISIRHLYNTGATDTPNETDAPDYLLYNGTITDNTINIKLNNKTPESKYNLMHSGEYQINNGDNKPYVLLMRDDLESKKRGGKTKRKYKTRRKPKRQ